MPTARIIRLTQCRDSSKRSLHKKVRTTLLREWEIVTASPSYAVYNGGNSVSKTYEIFSEQLRENDRQLRRVNRDVERDRTKLEREEKKIEAEIKKAAKAGNKVRIAQQKFLKI